MMDADRDLRSALERLAEHGNPAGPQTVLDRAELELHGQDALSILELASRPIPGRPIAVALAAAVIAVLIIAIPLVLLGGGAEEAAAVTEPAPVPTVTATVPTPATTVPPATTIPPATTVPQSPLPAVPAMTWERIPQQETFNEAFVAAVVPGGPGLVAVGYVLEEPPPADFASAAAVWVSLDGLSWERVDDSALRDTAELWDIAAGPLGLLAVGSDVMLISSDGTSWSRVEDDDAIGFHAEAVTAGGPGWVAVGGSTVLGSTVLVSEDGLSWDRVESDALAGGLGSDAASLEDLVSLGDVAAGGPGLVAVGSVGSESVGSEMLTAWVSADGRAWERLPGDTFGGESGLASVTADSASGSLVAFGQRATWTSNDGRQWVPSVDPEALSDEHPDHFGVWDGDRIVAWDAVMPWVSTDRGTTWYRVDTATPAFEGMSWPKVWGAARFGDRFVAVGGDVGIGNEGMQRMSPGIGLGAAGAVWIGQWEQ
jgi:hypothetical protein